MNLYIWSSFLHNKRSTQIVIDNSGGSYHQRACGRAISRREIENMGKIILCMCVYNVCAYVCVCTRVCVSAGHTCPAHIWKSEHRISLFSLLFMLCLLKRWPAHLHGVLSGKHRDGRRTPPCPARHGSWSFACMTYAYLLSYRPTFVSLYLLLFMDFMDLCRISGLQSLNGGDTSGQGVIR